MTDTSGSAPRVSVVTASYQRVNTLPRLYDSLRRQTTKDFEWVIVDDGSTDGTGDLVRGWQGEADFHIDYNRQVNQGKHAAINGAVQRARGEYCAIIDSDDWYPPDALERMCARWEEMPPGLREEFADVEGLRIDEAGDLICDTYPRDLFDTDAFELEALHGVEGDKIGMFRREVLREYPFPEDLGWHVTPALVWNRIAARYRTRCFNEVWAFTDYRPGGLTDRETELRLRFPAAQLTFWAEFVAMPRRMRRAVRLRAHANYLRYSLLVGSSPGQIMRGSPSPGWTAAAGLPGLFLYLRDRIWMARNRTREAGADAG